jgi:hypothetical protein
MQSSAKPEFAAGRELLNLNGNALCHHVSYLGIDFPSSAPSRGITPAWFMQIFDSATMNPLWKPIFLLALLAAHVNAVDGGPRRSPD